MRDSTVTKIWAGVFFALAVAGAFWDWSWTGFLFFAAVYMYLHAKYDFIAEELAEIKERLPK